MRITHEQLINKIFNLKTVLVLLLLLTIAFSLHQYLLPPVQFWDALRPHYNNYLTFKYSFAHLLQGVDLYILHPEDHGDYFKYSPTFAFFMGIFYYLPNWLGLILWNFLNIIVLFAGIKNLPHIDEKTKSFILLFVLIELITNLQNAQSNTLMAGLIILAFDYLERRDALMATLFISLSIYVKLFGVVAVALILLYPKKHKFVIYFVLWIVLLWLVPLLVIIPGELIDQYHSWGQILQNDAAVRYGFSVLGILHAWFGVEPDKWKLLLTGSVLFCIPLLRVDLYRDIGFRLLFLSSILLFVILFNFAAESSGYIICMAGIGIWFFIQEKNQMNMVLAIATFILISLIYTDITPVYYRKTYLYPYYIKAIPALLIWCKILYEMLFKKYAIKSLS